MTPATPYPDLPALAAYLRERLTTLNQKMAQ